MNEKALSALISKARVARSEGKVVSFGRTGSGSGSGSGIGPVPLARSCDDGGRLRVTCCSAMKAFDRKSGIDSEGTAHIDEPQDIGSCSVKLNNMTPEATFVRAVIVLAVPKGSKATKYIRNYKTRKKMDKQSITEYLLAMFARFTSELSFSRLACIPSPRIANISHVPQALF